LFGAITINIEEANESLLALELSLFFVTFLSILTLDVPLLQWKTYGVQFLHVGYLTWQCFGILSFQIEYEKIFNVTINVLVWEDLNRGWKT
jgi:hypothetical protein